MASFLLQGCQMVCNATSAPLPPTPSAVTLSSLKERSTRRENLYQKHWSSLKTAQQTRNTLYAERSTRMVRIRNSSKGSKTSSQKQRKRLVLSQTTLNSLSQPFWTPAKNIPAQSYQKWTLRPAKYLDPI